MSNYGGNENTKKGSSHVLAQFIIQERACFAGTRYKQQFHEESCKFRLVGCRIMSSHERKRKLEL